jgi:hypothetical protein
MFSLTIGTKQLKVSNVDHRNSVENVTAEIGMVVDLLGMVVKRNILNASRCGFNGWKDGPTSSGGEFCLEHW